MRAMINQAGAGCNGVGGGVRWAVLYLVPGGSASATSSSNRAFSAFVQDYHAGVRVFNGPKPSAESVRLVKGRLASRALLKGKA
jgi:hypothetical protein